jgi:hypothetical protein
MNIQGAAAGGRGGQFGGGLPRGGGNGSYIGRGGGGRGGRGGPAGPGGQGQKRGNEGGPSGDEKRMRGGGPSA